MNAAEIKIDPNTTVSLDLSYTQARLLLVSAGAYLAALQQGIGVEPPARDIIPALQDITAFTGKEVRFNTAREGETTSMTFTLSQLSQLANMLAYTRCNRDCVENDTGDVMDDTTIDTLGEYICQEGARAMKEGG